MNARASLIRKLIYVGLIVALLVPLSLIGMPAKQSDGGGGGMLAEMRRQNDISEASLGEIDPTSESVKLVMFGLRAPAITLLYERINEQQKRKQWDDQRATLEELAKLQPHFCGVWRHQAWNLSYNISAEWDDYKQRYRCVKEGIQFLQQGTTKNRREARMIGDMGWFTGNKIGRSDEHREFRQIFQDPSDDLFEYLDVHLPVALPNPERGHRGRRDNWLMSKTWYLAGEVLLENGEADLIGTPDYLFFSSAPMSQFNYAEAIETEGTFGDAARQAWDEGSNDFRQFGARPMAADGGLTVQINDWEPLKAQHDDTLAKLEALAPGLRQSIVDEKKAGLPDETKAALEVPFEQRTDEQHQLAFNSLNVTYVAPEEVAKRLPAEKKAAGDKLAAKIKSIATEMGEIEYIRGIVNFTYWRERAQMETRPDALEARRLSFLADQAINQGDLEQAKEHYSAALEQWKLVFAAHPTMAEDGTVGDDVAQLLRRYQSSVLDKFNEKLPEEPLYTQLLERFEEY